MHLAILNGTDITSDWASGCHEQALDNSGHCHNSSVDTVAYVMVGLICRLEQACCLSVSCFVRTVVYI